MSDFDKQSLAQVNTCEQESVNESGEFVPLKDHDDYEILNKYPYTIKRKRDNYVIAESVNSAGYPCVNINGILSCLVER